jgi:hypothetical protein
MGNPAFVSCSCLRPGTHLLGEIRMPNGFKKRLRPARIGKYFVLIAATGVIQRFKNAGVGGQIAWGKMFSNAV